MWDFPYFLTEKYKVISLLAKTDSSDLYSAECLQNSKKVVIKVSSHSENSVSNLSKEYNFLTKLQETDGIPKIIDFFTSHQKILILEQLGQSMEALVKSLLNFSLKNVIMLGRRLLPILQQIHEKGIIHRDIKPDNIVVGPKNQIYIIDYGISKKFIKKKVHISFKTHKKKFKGTLMFASRNAHFGYSTSRRDDLESLGYMLVYLYKGYLPWSNKIFLDLNTLGKIKNDFFNEGIFEDLPLDFKQFFEYIGKLKFEESPDYDYLSNLLLNMAERFHIDLNDSKWEWENLEEYGFRPKKQENASEKQEEIQNHTENSDRSFFSQNKEIMPLMPRKKSNNHKNSFNEIFKKVFHEQM